MSDVKGIEISDILGLSEPLTKLIDVCSSAIGTAYKPRHERKMTDAKVYEIKQIGEAIRDNSDLPVNYQYRNIGINITDVEDLAQRAQIRLLHEEMKRQQNVEAVADNAYEEIMGKEKISNVPVDEDWKTRFFSIAKDISSEGMQKLWGKILAGEISNPGSFSIRTLETIRNMSQGEATIFQRILPILLTSDEDWFIPAVSDLHDKYGITYDDILALDECGLMISNGTMSISLDVVDGVSILHNKRYCIRPVGLGERKREFTFGIYSLTRTGKELVDVLVYEPNGSYICDVAEFLFTDNRGINLEVQEVSEIIGNVVCTTGNIIKEFRQ